VSVRRDDDKKSNITHGSASMRRTSGHGLQMPVIGMPLLALRRDNGTRKIARYLAEDVPVIETGRLLSLEQVPTVGLRYGLKTREAYAPVFTE
jgi:hypothetical protein